MTEEKKLVLSMGENVLGLFLKATHRHSPFTTESGTSVKVDIHVPLLYFFFSVREIYEKLAAFLNKETLRESQISSFVLFLFALAPISVSKFILIYSYLLKFTFI